MILEDGVVRTMDRSVPTRARARDRGGRDRRRRRHPRACPRPARPDRPARALRAAGLRGRPHALPDLGARARRGAARGHAHARGGGRSCARCCGTRRARWMATRARLAQRRLEPSARADPRGPRRRDRQYAHRASRPRLPLAVAEQRGAGACERRPPGPRRRRRGRRARRPHRRPPRGGGLALPRRSRRDLRRRVRRSDAPRAEDRRRARRHLRPRQGRLDRRTALLAGSCTPRAR